MEIESLYEDYHLCTVSRDKDKVLEKVFYQYRNWIDKLAYKYSAIYPQNEVDDWKILVELGIWEGLEKADDSSQARPKIYYRVMHQIAKEIQLLTAEKQSYKYEVGIDPTYYGSSFEEDLWVTRMDIERAISMLPTKTQTIIKLLMKGVPVLIRGATTQADICTAVGLKDAAVYLRIKDALKQLEKSLNDYEEDINV